MRLRKKNSASVVTYNSSCLEVVVRTARPCLNSFEVEAFKTMEETKIGIRTSSSHRKRKHESNSVSELAGLRTENN